MLARTLAVTGAVMMLGAGSAQAAPTLAADQQCYAMGRDVMTLSGAGYSPGGEVALALSRNGMFGTVSATADASGAFSTSVNVPDEDWFGLGAGNSAAFPIVATDMATQPADPVAAPVGPIVEVSPMFSPWDVTVKTWTGTTVRPRRMTTFTASGWTTLGKTLYAHYVRSRRLVKTVKVGALTGACGNLTRHMREFPFRPVPAGDYRVQFDTTLAYHSSHEAYIHYRHMRVAPKDAVR